MGNCESLFFGRRRRDSSIATPRIAGPSCEFIEDGADVRVDLGYSFIDLELTASEALTLPPKNRLLVRVGNKVVCFNCVEMYAWLRMNPNAALAGPFGTVILTDEQKKHVVGRAESFLPRQDHLQQRDTYDWDPHGSDLRNLGKHITGSLPADREERTPGALEGPSLGGGANVCEVVYNIVVVGNGTIHHDDVREAIDTMVLTDDERSAQALVAVFVAHGVKISRTDRKSIINHCIFNRALGVLDALIRTGLWCSGFSDSAVTELIISSVVVGKEDVYKFLISLLEDMHMLPKGQECVDRVYAEVVQRINSNNWMDFFRRASGIPPSVQVLTAIGDDQQTDILEWLVKECDTCSEEWLRRVVEKLLSESKNALARCVVERFGPAISAEFVSEVSKICDALSKE